MNNDLKSGEGIGVLWSMVYGLWSVVYGLWSIVYVLCFKGRVGHWDQSRILAGKVEFVKYKLDFLKKQTQILQITNTNSKNTRIPENKLEFLINKLRLSFEAIVLKLIFR